MKKEIVLVLKQTIKAFFLLAIIILFIIYVAKLVVDIREDILSRSIPNYKELLNKRQK